MITLFDETKRKSIDVNHLRKDVYSVTIESDVPMNAVTILLSEKQIESLGIAISDYLEME